MTIQLRDAARWFRQMPHQLAAWDWLQEQLTPDTIKEFEEMYRAGPVAPILDIPHQQRDRNFLKVPYFTQLDSEVSGQAQRSCFSSSCAMLVAALRPTALNGPNADDRYLQVVMRYGDTTQVEAQLKAIHSFGINAQFTARGNFALLERQIDKGIPIPCGFLHKGPSTKPTGGGHWLTVVGYTRGETANGGTVIVNDPFGEMDVVGGSYLNQKGAGLAYSRRNWGPRWLADGPDSGWAIIAER